MKKQALSVVFLAAVFAALLPVTAQAEPPPLFGSKSMPTLAPMISQVTKSVVNISTQGTVKVKGRMNQFMDDPFFRHFFGRGMQQPRERKFHALGSGVIINADKGLVLTNHHVIDNANKITVILNDGRKFKAKVIGSDKLTDLAVLKIDTDNLDAIALGDSSQLNVGDFVVAIGNPFGLSHTATYGIVSGLGRSIGGRGRKNDSYQDFIQTDASINPGNSGGALVNLKGQLIGINTAILSKGGRGNIGIGFAIPVNMAKQVMHQLIQYGEVKRGRLGVYIQKLTPKIAQSLDVDAKHGALVSSVIDGTPADKAGIERGDVILSVDGRDVTGPNELTNIIGLKRPGTSVSIKLVHNGDIKQLKVTLGSSKATKANGKSSQALGARFGNIDKDSPLYGKAQGAQVIDVEPGGEAAEAGLRPGDVIIAVNRHPIKNAGQLRKALSQTKGTLLLTVRRDNGAFFTTIR